MSRLPRNPGRSVTYQHPGDQQTEDHVDDGDADGLVSGHPEGLKRGVRGDPEPEAGQPPPASLPGADSRPTAATRSLKANTIENADSQ